MNTDPPVLSRTANVLPFTVPKSIGSLKSTFTTAFNGTPVCWLNGASEITVGAVTSGPTPVVKCVVCGATAFPARSCTPATVTVIAVLSGNGSCITSNTSWLLLPKKIVYGACTCPPTTTATVFPFTVSPFTGALNRARTSAFTATFVAPSGGSTSNTCGIVVTTLLPVVKVLLTDPLTLFPATSFTTAKNPNNT